MTVEQREHVLLIGLDRPEKRNADLFTSEDAAEGVRSFVERRRFQGR